MAELTLLLPGLLGPMPALSRLRPQELPDLATLERLLARAQRVGGEPAAPEAALLARFGVRRTPTAELPVAPLTRLADGAPPDQAWWLRADPVHLSADRDRLVMVAHEALALQAEEARELAAELAPQLPPGWRLEVGAPHRWYLSPASVPDITTCPLSAALGRDVRTLLPRGPQGAQWRALLNETQMQLHGSAINAAREAAGRLPVNSLWFWGGGVLPAASAEYTEVWAEDPLARGLARAAGIACRPPPADAACALVGAPPDARLLLFDDRLLPPVIAQDPFAWLAAVADVQRSWLAPAWSALRRGALSRLILVPGDGTLRRLDRRAARRWWRVRRPLARLLQADPSA